jgi:phage tail tape-measure protein
VGEDVGARVGPAVGPAVGAAEGALVGTAVGTAVGKAVGARVGPAVGEAVGETVGVAEGNAVGASVGLDVQSPGPQVSVFHVQQSRLLQAPLVERWAQWSHSRTPPHPQCGCSHSHENLVRLKHEMVGASDGAEVHH